MGIIPRVDQASPAFIHVDVDDLWAIAECYGLQVAEEWAHHVSTDALPRFAQLFRNHGIQATFFIVGRDLESASYVELVRTLLADGHSVANHSYSHDLHFRALSPEEMGEEITATHRLGQEKLNLTMQGFRAPGYGWSRQLLTVLDRQEYRYDASLMPGPYGGIFRWMDRRISIGSLARSGNGSIPVFPHSKANWKDQPKTQYPLFSDTWNSLYPAPVSGTGLVEIPSATSGILRLPFQAGVCMRLGWPYFRVCFEPFRRIPALPFIFLFHAADLADFSQVPHEWFQKTAFFNSPLQERYKLAERFLTAITSCRPIVTTEQWLASPLE